MNRNLSRRDFLKLFTGQAVDTASRAMASALPGSESVAGRRQLKERTMMPALDQTGADLAHCLRCYAPFKAEPKESLCPDCREAEAKNRTLLGFFKGDIHA